MCNLSNSPLPDFKKGISKCKLINEKVHSPSPLKRKKNTKNGRHGTSQWAMDKKLQLTYLVRTQKDLLSRNSQLQCT